MSVSLLLRRQLIALLLGLFCVAVFAQRARAQEVAKPPERTDLELVISGPREDFPDTNWRQYHPRNFKMTLINHSSHPIVFGPNAPAAFASYDTVDWRVIDPSGKPVPYRPRYICRVGGLTSFPGRPARRITDESLFVIQPGESRDLGDFDLTMWFLLTEPGEYKIYRDFSFSPPRLAPIVTSDGRKFAPEYDASALSPEKLEMLRDSIPFNIRSNVWTLVIK